MTEQAPHSADASQTANIIEMFSLISPRYDLINRVASFGLARRWWKQAAAAAAPLPSDRVLDLCCGTGDMALSFLSTPNIPASITGVDLSAPMLEIAKSRQNRIVAGFSRPLPVFTWLGGDATNLPFSKPEFDIVSCSFGLRNIPNFQAAVAEAFRVLRPAGRLSILEFSLPKSPIFRTIYLLYFRHVLPLLAGLLSGKPKAYRYFVDSVHRWDQGVDLAVALAEAGFREIDVRPMTLGIITLYIARKP